jgi:NADP-dependent 3-hydroxy acid dehydrogenase YdfG
VTADRLAEQGASVAVAARREERLDELVDEIEDGHGTPALAVPTDVRDRAAVETLVERTVERFGGLDVLVNNAGLARGGRFDSTSVSDYRAMTETIIDGTFFATRAALSHLYESSGNLVFMGSYAGKFPHGVNPVYSATRWWVRGFAHSLQADVGERDVAVTIVNPSEVRTRVWKDEYGAEDILEPEEVAEAIVFAAKRSSGTVSELDLFRRSKLHDPNREKL